MDIGIREVHYVNGTAVEVLKILSTAEDESATWWLLSTPLPVYVVIAYLFIIYFGKKWMVNRPPYELTTVMRIYDLIQVGFNLYQVYGFLINPRALPSLILHSCYIDDSIDLDGLHALGQAYRYYFWCYILSKMLDLFDTIFMVLRKKNSHITFLHMYHHVGMVLFSWITAQYARAFQAAFPGFINENVHVIMYSYYFLATFPQLEPYLWWKIHLTKIQLIQFVIAIFYIGRIYYNGCPISKVFTYIWLFNITVILGLFVNFYLKSYVFRPKGNQQKGKSEKLKQNKQN